MKLMREYVITCKEAAKLKMKLDHADEQKEELEEHIATKEKKMKKIESKLLPHIDAKKGGSDWMEMYARIRSAYEKTEEEVDG
jgi:septal ring factor EnvC (AmiA/AmiB activator)